MFKEQLSPFIEQHLHMPFGVAANIIYTILTVVAYMGLSPILDAKIRKYLNSDEKKEALAHNILSMVLRLIAWAIVLKLWFTGETSLAGYLDISPTLMSRVVNTIVLALLYFSGRKVLTWISHIRSEDRTKQYAFAKTSNVIFSAIVTVILIKIWVLGEANLSTYFGLVSAGIAIALQDIIASFAGWIFIITVRPFWIGNRIQFDDVIGDVVDIRLFQVVLQEVGGWVKAEQSTGRLILVPNSFVFKKEIANYHAGFDIIFGEIPVVITFESDWKKARTILEAIVKEFSLKLGRNELRQLREAAVQYQIHIPSFDPIVLLSVEASGVNLTMRYPCTPRTRRSIEGKMWEAILDAFAKEDTIDLAYPTQRFYNNRTEGKLGAGGLPL